MRNLAAVLARLPYALFLFGVLAPLGALAYGAGAVVRTVYANAVAGWRHHG